MESSCARRSFSNTKLFYAIISPSFEYAFAFRIVMKIILHLCVFVNIYAKFH